MSQYFNPVTLYFGTESIGRLAAALANNHKNVQRVLLLTRGGAVEQSDVLIGLMSALQEKEIMLKELQFANPDLLDIFKLLQDVEPFDFGLIIAIGGGSVMDAAKAISSLHGLKVTSIAELRDMITEELYRKRDRMTPWVGIPTTSGTGSEVTSWATVWDEDLGCKYSLADERLYAEGALILPELTMTMPLRLSAVTALDAMCHATEAYWSIYTNPITRIYSLRAIELIRKFLPMLKDGTERLRIRSQLSLASLYAGLAFSNTKTTACHSISYPLTLLHGIEHGVAVSFTLGDVLRLNLAAMEEPERLLQAFGAAGPEDVRRFIFDMFELYELPASLGAYGATAAAIPAVVERAYTKGRMDNNPVAITRQQVQDILLALL